MVFRHLQTFLSQQQQVKSALVGVEVQVPLFVLKQLGLVVLEGAAEVEQVSRFMQ